MSRARTITLPFLLFALSLFVLFGSDYVLICVRSVSLIITLYYMVEM